MGIGTQDPMTLLSSRKKPEWFLPLSPMTWVPRSQERIGRLLDMSRCKGAKDVAH